MSELPTSITTGIMLATVAVSLWLGLFLVTRGGHSRRVWLAALAVLSVGSWFFYDVLQLSLPNYQQLIWLLWLGQLIKFAPTLWFQLSYQIRLDTGTLRPWQRQLGLVVIVIAYLLVLYNIWDTSRYFGADPFPGEIASYIYFLGQLIILPIWTMWNFLRAGRQMKLPLWRRQMNQLFVATLIAYFGGLYAGFSVYFRLPIPFFPSHIMLGAGIVLLGYGVVRYDALLEGRSIDRDALYSAVGVGLIALLYGLVLEILWLAGVATLPAVATILACAVTTHTLSDGGRTLLDRLFYRGEVRRLRADLRKFAYETGAAHTLGDQLELVLETVCQSIGVYHGFIAVRQSADGEYRVVASREARWRERHFAPATLTTDSIVDLLSEPNGAASSARGELEQMALIVPLAEAQLQSGALVLGNKLSGAPFGDKDLDYLDGVSHQLATMMESTHQQQAQAQELEANVELYMAREKHLQQQMQLLVAAPTAISVAGASANMSGLDEEAMAGLTEDALRHLNDYAYLGEHAFAKLRLIDRFLPAEAKRNGPVDGGITHLDQGKALHSLMIYAIEQLRPAGAEPSATVVPGREWHSYVILHDSYVKGDLTREIMARLYIGEGTYNRTRRRALRSVGKMIQEMEEQSLKAVPNGLAKMDTPSSPA